MATDYFLKKREMVVLDFSQCHRHGWSWRSRSPVRHVRAWMVGHFIIIHLARLQPYIQFYLLTRVFLINCVSISISGVPVWQ